MKGFGSTDFFEGVKNEEEFVESFQVHNQALSEGVVPLVKGEGDHSISDIASIPHSQKKLGSDRGFEERQHPLPRDKNIILERESPSHHH